jgi:hypothetical protein
MRYKPSLWKQKTPQEQLIAINSGFLGHLSNYQDNTITKEQFLEHARLFTEEMEILKYFLQYPEKW